MNTNSTSSINLIQKNAILFLAPWLLSFTLFFIGPILASLYLSFTQFDGLNSPVWLGLDNYQRAFNDANFFKSLEVTFKFAFLNLITGTVIAIFLAILLNQNIRGKSFFRSFLYLPSIVPVVASSMLWLWLFRELREPSILSDINLALPALLLIGFWSLGNPMLIYLAGLQNISESMYESADIDGANMWQKLWHITLPSLSPVILFNLIIGIIQVFQYFVPAYIMTNGGPQSATLFYSLYTYQKAFEDFQIGYASVLAWFLFVLVITLTGIAFWISKRFVHYN